MITQDKYELARAAGLRDSTAPGLEDANHRRTQLWLLSLLVACAIPIAVVTLGWDALHEDLGQLAELQVIRVGLVVMLAVLLAYAVERERALRRLSRLLADERVLTASLVARVRELDLLVQASRAMNSDLELSTVLDGILSAAYDLLDATGGSIQLVASDDPSMLEVAAVRGEGSRMGARTPVSERLANGARDEHEAIFLLAAESDLRVHAGAELTLPMEVRDELVGVLTLTAGPDRDAFTEFHLRSVAVFAETAAAAINNARALEASQRRVASLTELDRTKDEFLALVTHELRTPLTSIIGLAGTISKGADHLEARRVTQLADTLRAQGWQLDRLVDDLLETSRADRGALRVRACRVDPGAVARSAVAALEAATATHRLHASLPDEPLAMGMDADALRRVITNLVGNAVKYTAAGSSIAVELVAEHGGVVLTVADDGPGMSEGERARAFDKFHRGAPESDRNGLGLGLYIVRALAQAHGGWVRLEEASGGGLRAVVMLADLPVARPAAAAATANGSSAP